MAKTTAPRKTCPTCGKPMAGSHRLGSLTGFLFGAGDCRCSAGGGSAEQDDTTFCPRCGLKLGTQNRAGSLTGFLFQSTQCKCPPDKDFADGDLSSKFYRLKQADGGTIFSRVDSGSRGAAIGLAPGAVIGGVYQIIEMIGRGGMGEVYLARHQTLGKKCALKVIPPDQVTEVSWQRFQLEARAVAKLDHINLVRVTDLGIHEGCLPFYAMDLVEGKTLADLLAENGPAPLSAVIDLFMQVCDGVDCAHRSGVLHRDLKPANIMVQQSKTGQKIAKVLDFGLAKLTNSDRNKQSLTAVGDVFGSPFYMSPEQCNGNKLDRRSDIYSLGCTMFECLTGRPPFTGHLATAVIFSQLEADAPTLESVAGKGKFPEAMEIVMAKLLRKNPVERYQTLSELRSDLEKVARGETVEPFYVSRAKLGNQSDSKPAARPPHATDRQKSGTNKWNWLVPAAAVTLLLIPAAMFLKSPNKPKVVANTRTDLDPPILSAIGPGTSEATREKEAQLLVKTLKLSPKNAPIDVIKPYSSIVTTRTGPMRVFNFPKDRSIGLLRLGRTYNAVQARGMVSVPLNAHIFFEPATCILEHPDYVKPFRKGDIYGVRISDITTELNNLEDRSQVDEFFKILSAIPQIKAVQLSYQYNSFKEDDLTALEKFESLTGLMVYGTNVDTVILSKFKNIGKLSHLTVDSDDDIFPLLESIRNSRNITSLELPGSEISLSNMTAIISLPNLRWLRIGGIKRSPPESKRKALELLAKVKNLSGLSFNGQSITSEDLQQLRSFKSLKVLEFPAGLEPREKQKVKTLLRDLPNVSSYGASRQEPNPLWGPNN